jgi:hypothetical protein
MTTTTAATPAQRLLADYEIHYPSNEAAQELTDSKAAMLSWAGRDGRYTHSDIRAILEGHGETMSAWCNACAEHDRYTVSDAAALLTWLGY